MSTPGVSRVPNSRERMSRDYDNLDEALRAVAAGNLDALTPEQVARLERVLNDEPGVAARLAACTPAPEPKLATALQAAEQAALPPAQRWDLTWQRIDAAAPLTQRRAHAGIAGRLIRLWQPLVAAAACLMLAVMWRTTSSPTEDAWPMQLATDVQIDSLEVPDGMTSLIVAGGDDNYKLIWILPDES